LFFQGKMQQGRTDSVRPSNDQDWLLKIKLFRVCSMATRLIRVLRTCALGAPVFNALFPLDAISGEKLLYSNPRLLRSSQLGETCPPISDAVGSALFTGSRHHCLQT
jgi:hypothetical protein